MHLLQRQADGSFQLVYRTPNNIPPYAILSHTWEAEEVTFRDMVEGIGTTKAGYRKISFCGKQAASEGLQFFWVDTCCIDKDSSAELTEAINSMFRWYRNAAKCYVYLEDVSADSSAEKFKKSRWFTRGWTLQEMLASKCVEFFSTEGQLIGSKSSRVQEIAEITRIPTEALQGRPLSYFSVEQRMLWTKNRETTLEEDMAYSLLGIFDIHMPLIYGEGKERAFKRLRTEIKYDQENTAVMPLENAQGWLDTTIDKDVLEYSRQRLSDNNGWSKHEEDVALRSDFFKFVLRTPTALHETNKHFKLLMRNSNDKRRPDLIAVKKTGFGERSIEVHVVSGASHYSNFSLQIATPLKYQSLAAQYDFALSDWNGDGTSDLFMIKKNNTGTNSTEVHILSGASDFQDTMLQLGTVLDETDETFAFGMGRWNAGDTPDLFAIKKSKTGTNTTEVHVLSGATNFQSFSLQTGTSLHETDDTFDFVVTDWNGDGHPDLVAIKKNTNGGCTEVHVLSGASKYQEFILRAKTPLYTNDCMFDFTVADWTGNGKPDLIAVAKRDTGTNTTEVHIMAQQG